MSVRKNFKLRNVLLLTVIVIVLTFSFSVVFASDSSKRSGESLGDETYSQLTCQDEDTCEEIDKVWLILLGRAQNLADVIGDSSVWESNSIEDVNGNDDDGSDDEDYLDGAWVDYTDKHGSDDDGDGDLSCGDMWLPIDPELPLTPSGSLHTLAPNGHGVVKTDTIYAAVDLRVGESSSEASDIAKDGVSIYSPFDGIVNQIFDLGGGNGHCVIITESGSHHSSSDDVAVLCHVDPNVETGESVDAGEVVADLTYYIGTFGPHLHFELKLDGTWIADDGFLGTWEKQQEALGCDAIPEESYGSTDSSEIYDSGTRSGDFNCDYIDESDSEFENYFSDIELVDLREDYCEANNEFGSTTYTQSDFREVQYLVIHYTAGSSVSGAITGLEASGLSVHYIIDTDGSVTYLVDESDVAYHAGCQNTLGDDCPTTDGVSDYNLYSIGIELVNLGFDCTGDDCVEGEDRDGETKNWEEYDARQLDSLYKLSAYLMAKYSDIDLSFYGHDELSSEKNDPGPLFDWDEFLNNLDEEYSKLDYTPE